MSDQMTPGLYGKVPAHGDFIDRHLPVEFIRKWDSWLQQSVSSSRERLGEDWLNLYLTSSIWRFMLTPGALDQQCWAGVLVPSVDSVGRYFPLTIALPLPPQTGLTVFCQSNSHWFQALESTALGALQDGLNAEQMSAQLALVPTPAIGAGARVNNTNIAAQTRDLESALAAQLDAQINRQYDSASVWSSCYSDPQQQHFLIAQGMPTADQYTAMIDNQWQRWGWDMACPDAVR